MRAERPAVHLAGAARARERARVLGPGDQVDDEPDERGEHREEGEEIRAPHAALARVHVHPGREQHPEEGERRRNESPGNGEQAAQPLVRAIVVALGGRRPLQVETPQRGPVRALERRRQHEAVFRLPAVQLPALAALEELRDPGLGRRPVARRLGSEVVGVVGQAQQEGLPVEEDAFLQPRRHLPVVERVELGESRLGHPEGEVALRVHRPHVEGTVRVLLEEARLDLPGERRVYRQLVHALGDLGEIGPRGLDPLLLLALLPLREALAVLVLDHQAGDARDGRDQQHRRGPERQPSDQLLLGFHHDLPCDSRIRTGASASVTSAPSTMRPSAASDRPSSSGETGPKGAPGTRPSAVRRSPPVRIAHAPATSASALGTTASSHSARRASRGAHHGHAREDALQPVRGRRVVGAARERTLEPGELSGEGRALRARLHVRDERLMRVVGSLAEVQLEERAGRGVRHASPLSRRPSLSRSVSTARWKRDFSVPCGVPVTSAISAKESSRLQRSTTTSRM